MTTRKRSVTANTRTDMRRKCEADRGGSDVEAEGAAMSWRAEDQREGRVERKAGENALGVRERPEG